MPMDNPPTRTNFELLSKHLQDDSLAQKLLSAYTQASPDQAPESLKQVLRKRFLEVRDAIQKT